MERKTLSDNRNWLLLANYFVGYNFLYPFIANKMIKIYPNAHLLIYIMIYGVTFIINLILVLPIIKQDIKIFEDDLKHRLKIVFKYAILNFIVEISLSILISFFYNEESRNQIDIENFFNNYFVLASILACFFAPIVEESIFRIGILKKIEEKLDFKKALIISSFLFGFVHVYDALLAGEFGQLIYIIYYGGIGLLSGLLYHKNGEIISPMLFHLIHNLASLIANL